MISPSEGGETMAAIGRVTGDDEVQVLRERLADAERRLAERKVIDRAKGLLMAVGLTEDEAYRRLRQEAMKRQMRLGELALELLRNV